MPATRDVLNEQLGFLCPIVTSLYHLQGGMRVIVGLFGQPVVFFRKGTKYSGEGLHLYNDQMWTDLMPRGVLHHFSVKRDKSPERNE